MHHVSWTDLWICDESHYWRKNRLPRDGFISKAKCVHPISEEELWNTRTWCEIFSKLPAGYPKWPSRCLGMGFFGHFHTSHGHLHIKSLHLWRLCDFMHSLWLRITKFHLLLRQHSHLKCTIAVHSGSYFRGWGFLNPLFHIVVTKMCKMWAKKKRTHKKESLFICCIKSFHSFPNILCYSQRNMSKLPVQPNGVKRLKLFNGPTQQ